MPLVIFLSVSSSALSALLCHPRACPEDLHLSRRERSRARRQPGERVRGYNSKVSIAPHPDAHSHSRPTSPRHVEDMPPAWGEVKCHASSRPRGACTRGHEEKGSAGARSAATLKQKSSLPAPARGDLRVWLALRRSPRPFSAALWASSMKRGAIHLVGGRRAGRCCQRRPAAGEHQSSRISSLQQADPSGRRSLSTQPEGSITFPLVERDEAIISAPQEGGDKTVGVGNGPMRGPSWGSST